MTYIFLAFKYAIARQWILRLLPVLGGVFLYSQTQLIYYLIIGLIITGVLIDLGRKWNKTLPRLVGDKNN